MFILAALFSFLVPGVFSQSQQCSYAISVDSRSVCGNGTSIKLSDSWDWRNHKPSGKFLQVVNLKCVSGEGEGDDYDETDDGLNHLVAPCADYCFLELGFPPLPRSDELVVTVIGDREIVLSVNTEIGRGDTHFELNQCKREPAPGNKIITGFGLLDNAELEIPESCTRDVGIIDCGPQCNNPPPPSHEGEECSYDIKIKTSCDPFSGNPFGKVTVSIADHIGRSRDGSIQLAGNLLSFRNLDNPGRPDFTRCTLAEFTKKGPCIDFCGMSLVLEDTGLKWKVDYVEVSHQYVTHKFNIFTTLRPSRILIDGDLAIVVSSHCFPPPEHKIKIGGEYIILPDKCELTRNEFKDKIENDDFVGWIYCNCTKAEGGFMAL